MNDSLIETTIEVMGKTYQIKCAAAQQDALLKASGYLEEKMRYFRQQGVTDFEKIAVITALNVIHQLLSFENQKENQLQMINQRLHELKDKMEHALMPGEQMEFAVAQEEYA